MSEKYKKRRYTFCLLFFVVMFSASLAQTQEEKPIYFEKLEDGKTQFYFDDHYFLVDKFCQFKVIERVGSYDIGLKAFDGEFTDYNNDGNIILTGNYVNGEKEGIFTAYFPNGEVKNRTTFKAGIPIDTAIYNYPDGLPMLQIVYKNDQAYVWNFWDTHRRQRVANGDGKFEFAVKAEGYTEFGYDYINYDGKIVGGKPEGQWMFSYIYPDNSREYVGYERFEQGKFKVGYDEIEGRPYMLSRLQIGPSSFYTQAENMVSKNCTIDENQDFTLFILKRLEAAFSLYDSSALTTKRIVLDAEVDKEGNLKEIKVKEGFENEKVNRILVNTLSEISYWIPSYKDGEYIDDVFHISAALYVDQETKQLRFYNLELERENGI